MLKTAKKSYSLLSTVPTSDLLINVLDNLSNYSSCDDVVSQYILLLKESLVYTNINNGRKAAVVKWIESCLEKFSVKFDAAYNIEVDLSLVPAGIHLTKEQITQCKCIYNFLQQSGQFISLIGEHGYGKSMILDVAVRMAEKKLKYVRNIAEIYSSEDKNMVFVIRDTYISSSQMEKWLSLSSSFLTGKVVFSMATSSGFLDTYKQWILSNTGIIGIPYWEEDSLLHAVNDLTMELGIKKLLVEVHNLMVTFSQKLRGSSFPIFITSRDFVSFVNLSLEH